MPNNVIKSYAKRTGKTIKAVEKIWDETVLEANKRFDQKEHESNNYWAWVNVVVMNKLGIKTEKHKK